MKLTLAQIKKLYRKYFAVYTEDHKWKSIKTTDIENIDVLKDINKKYNLIKYKLYMNDGNTYYADIPNLTKKRYNHLIELIYGINK